MTSPSSTPIDLERLKELLDGYASFSDFALVLGEVRKNCERVGLLECAEEVRRAREIILALSTPIHPASGEASVTGERIERAYRAWINGPVNLPADHDYHDVVRAAFKGGWAAREKLVQRLILDADEEKLRADASEPTEVSAASDVEKARELVTLAECPPGLFLFGGTYGFKTEYGAMTGKDVGGGDVEWSLTRWPDVYVVESGEVFWGGVTSHEERAKLLVEPVTISTALFSSREGALEEALLAVVQAIRDYLPPDGIDAQECLNRIIAATDNSRITPLILEIENGRS